jgi:hypothetical protein
MSWQAFQLTLVVLSNIHVGYQKIGNVQRTRPYVPGRNLWAALTACLTRGAAAGEFSIPSIASSDYEAMGDKVSKELVFTYFYPAGPDGQPFYPCHTANGVRYGVAKLTPEQCAWRHLGVYASTSLDHTRGAAEDGSLHEVEFLASYTRADENGPGYPVRLVGYVLVSDECKLPWQKALTRVQLGGERRYGWGRVALRGEPESMEKVFNFDIILNRSTPKVEIPANSYLPAHALAAEHTDRAGTYSALTEADISGPLEPLVGREWDQVRGAGQRLSAARICWVPGSVAKRDLVLKIGAYGILEKENEGT